MKKQPGPVLAGTRDAGPGANERASSGGVVGWSMHIRCSATIASRLRVRWTMGIGRIRTGWMGWAIGMMATFGARAVAARWAIRPRVAACLFAISRRTVATWAVCTPAAVFGCAVSRGRAMVAAIT